MAKAPVITYLIADVDNQSDDAINMYMVVVVTGDGRQIVATQVSDYIDIWRETFASGDNGLGGDVAKYNAGIKLAAQSQFDLHPGARGTAVLGAKESITTVSRVFVYPAGIFGRVEARRIG